jgi:hypothetical protein
MSVNSPTQSLFAAGFLVRGGSRSGERVLSERDRSLLIVHRAALPDRLEGEEPSKQILILAWYALQLAQANETQPIPGKDTVGPFLEVRVGGIYGWTSERNARF